MKSSFRSLLSVPVRAALLSALTLGVVLPAAPGAWPLALGDGEPAATVSVSKGYWLVAADGAVFPFGSARSYGPNRNQGPDIVGMGRTADGGGYWMVDEDGDVFHYGNAPNLGSRDYNADDVVGFAARPQGDGYWEVASDGGIFSFGDAAFYGSTGAIRLNQPIVGMASTPSGEGYWLVATDGGIFAFGDAAFYGSTGAVRLNQPIVGMASTGTGDGYWLVATDGGIFAFGDAVFHGSTGALALDQPIIGMVAAPPNHRPVAAPDSLTLEEDSTATVAVLANDAGIGDAGIAVTVVKPPGHGTAVAGADGRITYTPARDYAGPDSLTYRVADGDGDQATAAVDITVTARNDHPVVPDWLISTSEDTAVTGVLSATDADGDHLTFALAGAQHGTVSLDGSAFSYTPDPGYNGPDGFVVAADDGHGGIGTGTVTVTVGVVNEQPAAADDAASTVEDTAVVVDVAANDTGLGDGGIVVTVDAATLDPATEGTATVTGGDITFLPAPNVTGTVAFDYTIADADGDTSRATVTVTATPVNDPPTIT
ncbi:MAG: Ig-like domain-containing protein, partial [Acidimicrobiia bacterium]